MKTKEEGKDAIDFEEMILDFAYKYDGESSYLSSDKFSDILGKTFKCIRNIDNKAILFITEDEKIAYKLYHYQDCYESVTVDDICGSLEDLVGNPILVAEEVVSEKEVNPKGVEIPEYQDESFVWTFYKIATIKGWVDIRWYGESNGYYSESVDFLKIDIDDYKKGVE